MITSAQVQYRPSASGALTSPGVFGLGSVGTPSAEVYSFPDADVAYAIEFVAENACQFTIDYNDGTGTVDSGTGAVLRSGVDLEGNPIPTIANTYFLEFRTTGASPSATVAVANSNTSFQDISGAQIDNVYPGIFPNGVPIPATGTITTTGAVKVLVTVYASKI